MSFASVIGRIGELCCFRLLVDLLLLRMDLFLHAPSASSHIDLALCIVLEYEMRSVVPEFCLDRNPTKANPTLSSANKSIFAALINADMLR